MLRRQDRRLRESETRTAEQVQAATARVNGFFDIVIDAMPYPAFVKRVDAEGDRVRIPMHHINRAYEDVFDISRSEYVGREDRDVWPKSIADAYYASDMSVVGTKRSSRFKEPIANGHGKFAGQTIEFEKLYVEHKGSAWIVGFLRPIVEDVNDV
jgi:hypothetical protein